MGSSMARRKGKKRRGGGKKRRVNVEVGGVMMGCTVYRGPKSFGGKMQAVCRATGPGAGSLSGTKRKRRRGKRR